MYIDNPEFTILLFAVLIKRAGGITTITQQEIDEVAYNRVLENYNADTNVLTLKYEERKQQS